jgi:hypothetical protein
VNKSQSRKKAWAIAQQGDGRGDYADCVAHASESFWLTSAHHVTIWTRCHASALQRVEGPVSVRPVFDAGVRDRITGVDAPAERLMP